METTSPPTSSEPSNWSRSRGAVAAWLVVAGLLVVVGFAGQAVDGGGAESDILFQYEFAIGSTIAYAVVVGITVAIASAFPHPRVALGFRSFPLRWLWITFGLTLLSLVVSASLEPVLHAGEEQGLAPTEWQEGRAAAFAVNSLVVVLVAPFAEELFFRGLGVRVLGFLGVGVAVGGTALAFALSHGLLVGLPALGFFGAVLAWVRFRTESVWPGFIAHATYNGIGILFAVWSALNADERERALALLF